MPVRTPVAYNPKTALEDDISFSSENLILTNYEAVAPSQEGIIKNGDLFTEVIGKLEAKAKDVNNRLISLENQAKDSADDIKLDNYMPKNPSQENNNIINGDSIKESIRKLEARIVDLNNRNIDFVADYTNTEDTINKIDEKVTKATENFLTEEEITNKIEERVGRVASEILQRSGLVDIINQEISEAIEEIPALEDIDNMIDSIINTKLSNIPTNNDLQDKIKDSLDSYYNKLETDEAVENKIKDALTDYLNKNQVSTKIDNRIDSLVNSAPGSLDTLREIADALNNDPNFASTIINLLNNKLDKNGIAANSEKINGLTVETAVPANAKFTDTTYNVFKKSGSGAKEGLVPAPSEVSGNTKFLREDCSWSELPTATSSTLGVIKTGSNISNSNGTISLTKSNVNTALGLSSSDTIATQSWVNSKLNTGSSGINEAKDERYLRVLNNKKFYDNTFQISQSNKDNIVYLHNGRYKVDINNEGKYHYARLYKIDGSSETLINQVNVVTDTNDNNYYQGFSLLKISENALWISYSFYNGSGKDAWDAAEAKKTNIGAGNATYAICPWGGYFWKSAYINASGVLALSGQYTYVAADDGKYNAESNPNPVCHQGWIIDSFWNTDAFVLLRCNDTYSKYTDPDKDYGLTWYNSSSTSTMQQYTVNRDTGVITAVGDAVGLGTQYYDEYNSNGVYVNGKKNRTDVTYSRNQVSFYNISISGSTIYINRIKDYKNEYIKYYFPIISRDDQTYANNADMTPTSYTEYQYLLIGYNAALSAAAAPSALKIETGNSNTGAYNRLIIQDLPNSYNSYWSELYDFIKLVINITYINNKVYFVILNKNTTNLSSILDKDKTLSYRSDWYDYYFDLYTIDIATRKIIYAGKVSEVLSKEVPWAI